VDLGVIEEVGHGDGVNLASRDGDLVQLEPHTIAAMELGDS
jgi:hypothetical protein